MFDFGLSGLLLHVLSELLLLVVVLLLFGFWICMLVHCLTNPSLASGQRIVWLVVIFLGTWVGALIYALARPSGSRPRHMRWWVAAPVVGVLLWIGTLFGSRAIERQRLHEATLGQVEARLALKQAAPDAQPADVAAATDALNAGDAEMSARAYEKAKASYQKAKELAERAAARGVEGARLATAARSAAEDALRAAQELPKARQGSVQALVQAIQPGASHLVIVTPSKRYDMQAIDYWTEAEFAAAQEAMATGNAQLSSKASWEAKASYERAKALAEQAAAAAADVAEALTAAIKVRGAIDAALRALENLRVRTGDAWFWTSSEVAAVGAATATAFTSMNAKAYKDARAAFAKAEELAAQLAKTTEPLGRSLTAAIGAAGIARQSADRARATQYAPSAWKEAVDTMNSPVDNEPGEISVRLERTIATHERAKRLFDRATKMAEGIQAIDPARKAAAEAISAAQAVHADRFAASQFAAAKEALDSGQADVKDLAPEKAKTSFARAKELAQQATKLTDDAVRARRKIQLPSQPGCSELSGVVLGIKKLGLNLPSEKLSGNLRHEYDVLQKGGSWNIIADDATELIWLEFSAPARKTLSHNMAETYARMLNTQKPLGFSDWGLPTIQELAWLTDEQLVVGGWPARS